VTAEATARHTFAGVQIPADRAQAVAHAQAERGYQVAGANAYKVLGQAHAALDRGYWITETAALAAVGAAFAASNGTPWAYYDAAEAAAYLTWVTAAANAQETLRVATADAEKTAEIALADADLASASAVANANANAGTAVASADLSLATAQASMIASLGAGGSYQATYPEVSTAPDLAGRYAIPAASAGDYQATITASYSSNYYYSYWGWYGMGGLGWYGGLGYYGGLGGWGYGLGYGSAYYDAYYSGLGGYGWYGGLGGWFGGWSSGWWNPWWYGYGLTNPPEPDLEPGYWNIRGAVDKVLGAGAGELARYLAAPLSLLQTDSVPGIPASVSSITTAGPSPAATPPPLAPTAFAASAAPAAAATATSVSCKGYSEKEVADILGVFNPDLGAFWRGRGHVVRVPFGRRDDGAAGPSVTVSVDVEPRAGNRPAKGRALQDIWVTVPNTWNSAQVARYIQQQAAAENSPLESEFASFQRTLAADQRREQQLARERELAAKFDALLNEKLELGDALAFATGVREGLIQGVKDGLLGMAWSTSSFLFQINPVSRGVGYLLTGGDIGADEEAMLLRFSGATWEAIKKAPETIARLAEVKQEVEQFLFAEGARALTALIEGDRSYLDSRMNKLSPLAQEALDLARTAVTEIGIFLVDHMDAKSLGKLVGQVIYEVIEDAVITAAVGALELATAGGAMPVAGAAVAAKGAKLVRLLNRLEKLPGFNAKSVVKALDRLQDLAVWMMKYPMCFVAGTKVHTPSGLKNIEDIRPGDLVLTRDEHDPTSENRFRRVLELFQTNPKRLLTIRFQPDETRTAESLTCTREHPFYVSSQAEADYDTVSIGQLRSGTSASKPAIHTAVAEVEPASFVAAKDLHAGDKLVLADGREATVLSIQEQQAPDGKTFTTYNLAVEGHHTYFVGEAGVWVHNTGNPCDEAFEIFAKKFADTDNPIVSAKAARDHLATLVDEATEGTALYRKHFSDLEQLVVKEFETEKGSAAWKKYLESIKGAAPDDMPNAHAHHVLFKKGLREAQQSLVREGQDLLRKVGIDPLFGKEVLYWAPNAVKDQHSGATLLKLVEDLRALSARNAVRQDYVKVLEKHAKTAARRT